MNGGPRSIHGALIWLSACSFFSLVYFVIVKSIAPGQIKTPNAGGDNYFDRGGTYASMMLSAREHSMWVAKQMGHADWTMIARVYGRWMPDADLSAGSKAEIVFGVKQQ